MPFAGFKDFDECVNHYKGKGAKDPNAVCAVIMRKVEKGKGNKAKSNTTRANALMGGLELTAISGKDLPDLSVLAGVEMGELMEFKGAVLARAEVNRNADELTPSHIDQLADTLKGTAITDDHAERNIVGYITASHSRNKSSVAKIDGVIFARRFPEIAEGIRSGKLKLSVEADADQAGCSKCGKIFSSQKEYCEHINPVQNRFASGAYRTFPGPIKGVGAGVVRNPAGTDTTFDTNRLVMIAGLDNEIEASPDAVPDLQANPYDVNYRVASSDDRRCGVCEYFNKDELGCKLVAGFIAPGAVCDLFEKGEPDTMALEKEYVDRLLKAEEELKKMKDEKDEKEKDMEARIQEAIKAYLGEGLPGNPAPGNRDLPTPPGFGEGAKKEEYVKSGTPSGWQMEAAETVFARGMAVQQILSADEFKKHMKAIPTFTAENWALVEAIIDAKKGQIEAAAEDDGEADGNVTMASLVSAFEQPRPQVTVSRNGRKPEPSLYGGIKGE